MKLLNVKASFFCGFVDAEPISLESPLVILFGPNGSGKTAFAEALEWLFFGTTQRRVRGDVDEVEHRGALKNVLCPEDANPFVEVQVRLSDESIRTLRRTLYIDGTHEWTVAYVDGNKVPDFLSVGLVDATHFCPIIVQHNLQQLILCTGASRRTFISRLLGLEPLLAYDRAVNAASNRFVNSLPDSIAEFYSAFQNLTTTIGQWEGLEALRQRWTAQEVEYPADWQEILEYCRDALQMPGASSSDIENEARRRAYEARRAVFDTTRFEPRQNLAALIASCDEYVGKVNTDFAHLRQSLANYAAARARAYAQLGLSLDPERLDFWRTGLAFLDVSAIPDGQAVECPFCEELTITTEKADMLRKRLDQTDQCTQTKDHVEEVAEICRDRLHTLLSTARALLPRQLDETSRNRLATLLPSKLHEIKAFSDSIDATHSALGALERPIQSADFTPEKLLALADDPDQAETVTTFLSKTPTGIADSVRELQRKAAEHSETFATFRAVLQPTVASDETVRRFEIMQRLVASRAPMLVASEVLRMREQLRGARQVARQFLNKEDRTRIQQRGDDIGSWFELLYGRDQDVVGFGAVDPRGTVMRLYARILGHDRHASTHLSQSQLNCLGLALHIVSATATGCPFDFMVFDDPVQSFDDEVRESFLGPAVSRLLDEFEKQVIVLTHLRNLADRLRYGNERRRPRYYRFMPFSDAGVQLKECNRLRSDGEDIRRRARGDDVERTVACQRLRSYVEHLARAIYQAKTSQPVPRQYETCTGRDLLILLESIPAFPRPDLDYLRDSTMFGQQPSHDDPTWSPPNTQTIAHRMDRLVQIGRDHGLNMQS